MALKRSLMPSITELIAFEAVARLCSFTRAADELCLTQGAISKQVRQLETTLGTRLFARSKHHLEITEDGRTYLNDIRPVLRKLEHSTSAVVAGSTGRQELNCAVLPSFATGWLAPRLSRFAALHPDTALTLRSYAAPFDFAGDMTLDAAIHMGRPNWPGTTAHHLFDAAVVPVASPGYRERLDLRSPRDLERATLIHHATRAAYWRIWLDREGLGLCDRLPSHTLDHYPMIATAAASGLGVALVPRFLIETELADGRLVQMFGRELQDLHSYYFVVPHRTASRASVDIFLDWLLSEISGSKDDRRRV